VRLVVTGSAGRLAGVLIPRLAQDPRLADITGIDRREPVSRLGDCRQLSLDLRSSRLEGLLRGHDAIIHMAFALMGGGLGRERHDRERVRDNNLGGTRNLAQAALQAGVRRLIFVSSVAVYGAWPDNPPLIDEDRPLRPNAGFGYAEDKAAAEQWLEDFGKAHPELEILRLRLHAIIGPGAHPLLRLLLRQPFYPATGIPRPLTQCVCEDDAAAAIERALHCGSAGAYNIAAQPPLSFYDMLGLRRRSRLPCPLVLAGGLQRLAWQLTPAVGEPGWVSGLRHDLAVDTTRARERLGWTPRLDTRACITGSAA
jgi:nucleoside-diphosphate-sugar epimerase